MKIFRVKGSNPERFCIAHRDSAEKTKGYTMTTKFATEEELREFLKAGNSQAEIETIIQQARDSEA